MLTVIGWLLWYGGGIIVAIHNSKNGNTVNREYTNIVRLMVNKK